MKKKLDVYKRQVSSTYSMNKSASFCLTAPVQQAKVKQTVKETV